MININNAQIGAMEKQYRINLINSLTGYKALSLLGTINAAGVTNLCLVSSAFHLGANPPLIGIVMRPQRQHNETLANIKATGQYTLNNVLPAWYRQAHQASASYPAGMSEFDECGFEKQFIPGFNAPFVAAANVKIGLALREIIAMKINGTTIVVGQITEIMVDEPILQEDGTVDHVGAQTVTVAGLDTYCLATYLGRLTYAKPYTQPHEINTGSQSDD